MTDRELDLGVGKKRFSIGKLDRSPKACLEASIGLRFIGAGCIEGSLERGQGGICEFKIDVALLNLSPRLLPHDIELAGAHSLLATRGIGADLNCSIEQGPA